jgi:hypothetical protein
MANSKKREERERDGQKKGEYPRKMADIILGTRREAKRECVGQILTLALPLTKSFSSWLGSLGAPRDVIAT